MITIQTVAITPVEGAPTKVGDCWYAPVEGYKRDHIFLRLPHGVVDLTKIAAERHFRVIGKPPETTFLAPYPQREWGYTWSLLAGMLRVHEIGPNAIGRYASEIAERLPHAQRVESSNRADSRGGMASLGSFETYYRETTFFSITLRPNGRYVLGASESGAALADG